MIVLLGVDGPGVLYDTSFRLKINTALYVYWASRFVQVSLFYGQMLDIKDSLSIFLFRFK